MLLLSLLLPALAQDDASAEADTPEDFSDVVLVWPDKFARWKDTRWLVASELVVPTGLQLNSRTNIGLQTFAFQVRAVVSCDQDYKLGRKRIEVGCTIEDFMIKAAAFRRENAKGREIVQKVLDEIDSEMTGAKVQLQVSERGAVQNVDLEGIDTRNLRERRRLETLRQITARLFLPFHMKLPKAGVKEGNWPEFDSQMMSMPSTDGTRGFSTIVHWMNFYKGYLLVQDVGSGVVTVTQVPITFDDPSAGGEGEQLSDVSKPTTGLDGNTSGGSASRFDEDTEFFDQSKPRDFSYRLGMNGVSIYNIDNGIMEERVWSMTGTPTGSNPTQLKYWYSGRIQLLGSADTPDIGATEQVAYPGRQVDGIARWLPVDPELEKDLKARMHGGSPR